MLQRRLKKRAYKVDKLKNRVADNSQSTYLAALVAPEVAVEPAALDGELTEAPDDAALEDELAPLADAALVPDAEPLAVPVALPEAEFLPTQAVDAVNVRD